MKQIAISLLTPLVFVSCAPSTPQARIEKNPANFAALGAKEQELVQQGRISTGMPPEAVELAWGPPSRRLEGARDSKPTEHWIYTGTRPVYFNNFASGYRYGYGGCSPYGSYGYTGIALGIGPEVAYIPYQVASVRFINQRVDSWEREY